MLRIYPNTDKNRRASNQDRMTCTSCGFRMGENVWVLAVADGMGGMADGERYAELALRGMHRCVADAVFSAEQICIDQKRKDFDCVLMDVLQQDVDSILEKINRYVIEVTEAEELDNGGSTISACVVTGDCVLVLNTGDSPIYLSHADTVTELSVRDNVAEKMVREGVITRDSEEYKMKSSGLISFIGNKDGVLSHSRMTKLTEGDVLIIGSDGAFGDMNCAQVLKEKLSKMGSVSSWCSKLFLEAKKTTNDNQTLIVAEYFDKTPEKKRWRSIFG